MKLAYNWRPLFVQIVIIYRVYRDRVKGDIFHEIKGTFFFLETRSVFVSFHFVQDIVISYEKSRLNLYNYNYILFFVVLYLLS